MTSRSSAGRAPDDDPSTSAAIVVDDAMSPTELAHTSLCMLTKCLSSIEAMEPQRLCIFINHDYN